MKNNNRTKRALVGSIISMILSFVMLLGTTFAWYTDSVSSGVNRIQAGNLDIDLMYFNPTSTAEDKFDSVGNDLSIFQIVDNTQWVPGGFVYAKLKVTNNGSLALKYTLDLLPSNFPSAGGISLVDVVEVYEANSNIQTDTAQNVMNAIRSLTPTTIKSYSKTSNLLQAGESEKFTIVLHWPSSINDNNFNPLEGTIFSKVGIQLIAYQATKESDSFDNQYDKDAVNTIPAGNATATGTIENATSEFTLSDPTSGLTVTIPANVLNDGDEITSEMIRKDVTSDSVTYDISFKVGGTKRIEFSKPIKIERNIGANLKNVTITHKHGEDTDTFTKVDSITGDAQFTYDSVTGVLVISSKTFSEFRIGFTQKLANDVNSNELFAKLITEDKENIVINLVEDINFNLDNYYSTVLGGNGTKSVTINGNGHKLTFVSSYRNAINANGKLTINDAVIDSTYKPEGSTWDDYDILFKANNGGGTPSTTLNELVLNNVTFKRAVAIEPGVKAKLDKVTIDQTSATDDMYALWISAGADVTLMDCKINSINPTSGKLNRAIKIADEYVTNPQLTKLSVSGTTFASQKKSAVLVTTKAGAEITWGENNDISGCANPTVSVTVDNGDEYKNLDNVTVNGTQAPVEQ